MTDPIVSVVIPTYRRVAELPDALASLERQTLRDFEVLIVDNHSDDGTAELIAAQNDPRLNLSFVHNNGIIAHSRNAGLAAATGRYIAFLDSDDWWADTKLERSVEALEGGADISYHDLLIAKDPCTPVAGKRIRTWSVADDPLSELVRNGNALANSSVVVRRETLSELRQAENADLVGMEDFDLWLRLAKAGARFARMPEALGHYRVGDGNFTNPTRSLTALRTLRRRHDELAEAGWWFDYGMGRANYLLGHKREARTYLRRLVLKSAPLAIRAKAMWMLLR
ncbi:glycosyltransferase family 2 protein [Pontivivens insulae]|uniref:UDP-Glc:alpha-D-GlcNAc-diphosphoundecaprenol beta-1,3-glucosyltransferase WfgD n=1 Tax=Pontivivens insulae TaxID=1639689 RepID=A0A2R8A7G3_9RHOB|nr:glycosyltransferase [Pontivivens insulae]RED18273.1 glycosyl transferase family 2 [Pontivivens insulae]SPF28171.1 UDP-Glc:alpha-D-GlcNAc-diphosphoundecaprenol beta-1,3-glucosyltransferase WfgD [Pontivivens insulae]